MDTKLKVFLLLPLVALLSDGARSDSRNSIQIVPWTIQEIVKDILDQSEQTGAPRCVFFKSRRDSTPAKRRAALVIGIGAYNPQIGWIDESPNDAKKIAVLLLNLGFDTYVSIDSKISDISFCLDKIILDSNVESADTMIFYYSGHGIQINDQNYILPADILESSLQNVAENALNFFPISTAIDTMRASSKRTYIFLDACRSLATDSLTSKGLSISTTETSLFNIGAAKANERRNEFLIMYATQPGNVAITAPAKLHDGLSTFTTALIDELSRPNKSIQESMVDVTKSVGEKTDWIQHPFMRSTLSKMYLLNYVYDASIEIEQMKTGIVNAYGFLKRGQRKDALRSFLEAIPEDISKWPEYEKDLAYNTLNEIFTSRFAYVNLELLSESYLVLNELFTEGNFFLSPSGSRGVSTLNFSLHPLKKIYLWNTLNGSLINTINIKIGSFIFEPFQFSPDGKFLTVVSADGELFLFSADSGALKFRKKLKSYFNKSTEDKDIDFDGFRSLVSFSPSGNYLLVKIDKNHYDPDSELGGFVILNANTGETLFDGSKWLENILPAFALDNQLIQKLRLNQREIAMLFSAHRTSSDLTLNFEDDDSLCVFIHETPLWKIKKSMKSRVSNVFSGRWNWHTRELNIDSFLSNAKIQPDFLPLCHSNGARIFRDVQFNDDTQDFDGLPVTSGLQEYKIWFIRDQKVFDFSNYVDPGDYPFLYQFSKEGTRLAISGVDTVVIDLINFEKVYHYQNRDENKSPSFSRIFSNSGSEIGYSSNSLIDSRILNLDKSFASLLEASLQEFSREDRVEIEAKRQGLNEKLSGIE